MGLPKPPYWPLALIRWFCSEDHLEEIEGDLLESYERDLSHYAKTKADIKHFVRALKFISRSHFISKSTVPRISYRSLVTSALKTSMRNALRERIFTFLNLAGLSLGLTASIFLTIYLLDERSYDRYHPDANRIYRITDGVKFDHNFSEAAITPSGWADGLSLAIPEIAAVGRIQQATRFNPTIKVGQKVFTETSFIFIDSTLLNIFHFDFIYRKPGNPLTYPNAIVINEEIALKYFGDNNPVDQVLIANGETNYMVTGVVKMPRNNSFRFDFAALLKPPKEDRLWTHTFLKTQENTLISELEAKLGTYLQETYGQRPYASRQTMTPKLQPLTDIHHYSDLKFEYGPNSSVTYIYLFSFIALIIITITLFNFINLYTARALSRVKEIEVRKVIGALKTHITLQFLLEGLVYMTAAFLVSCLLVLLLNPLFNQISGKQIEIFNLLKPAHILVMFIIVLVMGIGACCYPAVWFSTINYRRNNCKIEGSQIRKILVIGQFSLSTIMIIGALIIGRQLNFFQNQELGFDKMKNLVLKVSDKKIKSNHESFRNELLKLPEIQNVSFTQTFPGEREKMAVLVYKAELDNETTIIPTFLTDLHFVKALELPLISGRYFDASRPNDRSNCMINQKAAELMGWGADAIGKEMHAVDLNLKGQVIGVIKDFHFASLHNEIEPLVVFPVLQFPQAFNSIIINSDADEIDSLIPKIRIVWNEFTQESPFNYAVLNDDLNLLYAQDFSRAKVFELFMVLSVAISCLGLIGLTIYSLETKTKEISIRKVLGASNQDITIFASADFLKNIVWANLIAIPVAYYSATLWLEDFAYRIRLTSDLFLLASMISVGLAFTLVSILAFRKAGINPAQQLKSE